MLRPKLRVAVRWLLVLLVGFAGLVAIGGGVFALKCVPPSAEPKPVPSAALERRKLTAGLPDYARPEGDSFLTYPEWYIVWSYQEKADYQERHLPSGFAYLGAIGQYWSSYCRMNRLTRGRYPFDAGDHLMLWVIGTSFTMEYLLKGAYENTLGRVSEWLSSHEAVEEDAYAYRVARRYADFVHVRPFYEFSFLRAFSGLWKETRGWGPHPLRKWERRIWLGFDYAFEAFYCELIERATHLVYGIEGVDTFAWIENAGDSVFVENPRVRKVKVLGGHAYLVAIPRYQEFTTTVARLAQRGVRLTEVAGNDEIVVSALVPRAAAYDLAGATLLFATDVLTQPEWQRLVLSAPVPSLPAVLTALQRRGAQLEHLYDY